MPTDPRFIAQVDQVLNNLPRSAAYPPVTWRDEGLQYLYREHTILVRQPYLGPARTLLDTYLRSLGLERDDEPVVTPVVGDVARLDYVTERVRPLERARAHFVIDELARQLGEDGVRLEAVLTLAPHPCPATEPEEVPPGTTRPFPDVDNRVGCRSGTPPSGCGCGCGHGGCGHGGGGHGCCQERGTHRQGEGVSVTVADLGFLKDIAPLHDWMTDVDGDPEQDTFYLDGGNQFISPYAGHGTFVAGCVKVTAPRATVYVERDLEVGAPTTSSGSAFEVDVVLRLADALTRTPDIVVFEFAAATRKCLSMMGFDALYESRIKPLKGLAFLAPAGNQGAREVQWPAGYDWAISVGALSANWQTRAAFSNFGNWVDVYAPGEGLVNAFARGDYKLTWLPGSNAGSPVIRQFDGLARWSGTSFATPLVAGLIASRMSCTGENARQAADALLSFARSQAMPGVGPVLFPGQACCRPPCHCCR